MRKAVDRQLVDKRDKYSQVYQYLKKDALILCAVSGGADSMCLLHLLKAQGYNVAAVHFNHNLRGSDSDSDERFVRDYCEVNGIDCHCGSGDVRAFAKEYAMGIEEAARSMRYAFFEETAVRLLAPYVATAHTADDNLETVLLNLCRGSGIRGLSGIPPRRGIYVRPIIGLTRADVCEYLKVHGVPYIEDASNFDLNFMRNRIRKLVIPVLREVNPKVSESARRASELLRQDDIFLTSLAEDFLGGGEFINVNEARKLHISVASRVVRIMAGRYGTLISSAQVSEVLAVINSESPSAVASLPDGLAAYRENDKFFIACGIPESVDFTETVLEYGKWTKIEAIGLEFLLDIAEKGEKINRTFNTLLFKKDMICGKISVRPRKAGDSIKLNGTGGTKTLKKLFIERKIPVSKRQQIPVICDEGSVIAVYSVGISVQYTYCGSGDCVQIIVRKCEI